MERKTRAQRQREQRLAQLREQAEASRREQQALRFLPGLPRRATLLLNQIEDDGREYVRVMFTVRTLSEPHYQQYFKNEDGTWRVDISMRYSQSGWKAILDPNDNATLGLRPKLESILPNDVEIIGIEKWEILERNS